MKNISIYKSKHTYEFIHAMVVCIYVNMGVCACMCVWVCICAPTCPNPGIYLKSKSIRQYMSGLLQRWKPHETIENWVNMINQCNLKLQLPKLLMQDFGTRPFTKQAFSKCVRLGSCTGCVNLGGALLTMPLRTRYMFTAIYIFTIRFSRPTCFHGSIFMAKSVSMAKCFF